jgi:hypothetical protein
MEKFIFYIKFSIIKMSVSPKLTCKHMQVQLQTPFFTLKIMILKWKNDTLNKEYDERYHQSDQTSKHTLKPPKSSNMVLV